MNTFSSSVPTFDVMFLPTVKALQNLGGSGTNQEIYDQVIQILNLPDAVLEIPHKSTSWSEVKYRLTWTRDYLKKYGIIDNSSRGVWSLISNDIDINSLEPEEIVKFGRNSKKNKNKKQPVSLNQTIGLPEISEDVELTEISEDVELPETLEDVELPETLEDEDTSWDQKLHEILLVLDPRAFEHLVQRLLRESGFIQVEVTGKSGDGGIDGVGIARINGFLSFHILFQCKRYKGSITSAQIRDFRGAMQGRTDKGLFITTGTFTRDAIKEATRDGAPPIDLIDGEQLVQRLKELGLGVKITMVESVDVDANWFQNL